MATTTFKDADHLNRIEKELERRIYEESYYEFYKKAFCQLHPGVEYDENWHARYLCDVLQKECERIIRKEKRTKDIIINVPFRSSKSMIATVIFPVWCWTRDPSLKFITVSYSGNLAIEHSSRSLDLILSQWFQRLYSHRVVLKQGQQAKGHYETIATGSRRAVGTGGQITGSGADILIIDDPQDPQMAASEKERENTINFFNHTLYSRLNDPDVGMRIVVMQRLHENDLTGTLLDKKSGRPDDHFHICIPGEYSERMEEIISPKELKEKYIDNLFWVTRFNRKTLGNYLKTLGSLQYAGQILQLPAPLEGNLVKRDWFEILQPNIITRDVNKSPVVFFMDTAYTEKQTNDPSAILGCFEKDGKIYVLNTGEVYMEFPKLIDFTQQYVRINDYSPSSIIFVEPKASGKSLVQQLRSVSKLNVTEIESDMLKDDKTTRLSAISPIIQSGKVVLIKGQWNEYFLTQVCSFPNAAHDEFVDLLCYAVDTLLVRGQDELMAFL